MKDKPFVQTLSLQTMCGCGTDIQVVVSPTEIKQAGVLPVVDCPQPTCNRGMTLVPEGAHLALKPISNVSDVNHNGWEATSKKRNGIYRITLRHP